MSCLRATSAAASSPSRFRLRAQQPAPGTWAGLVSLETTLGARKGKHYLASTTGCAKKKHAFSTVLTFVDNTVGAPGNDGQGVVEVLEVS